MYSPSEMENYLGAAASACSAVFLFWSSGFIAGNKSTSYKKKEMSKRNLNPTSKAHFNIVNVRHKHG
jgi:hypothetical protein